ncbi:IS110 family transposase, partial [Roseibacillus persicicus]|uniref:IS110 family transposase n=1 Tax=Roseibacillus persicicus TaxID=454148 RepID=UPI001671D372
MNHRFHLGIDRSDSSIDFCLLDETGTIVEQGKVPSAPEDLQPWVLSLKARLESGSGTIAACIEQPCINLTHYFRQFDFLALYLVNPAVIKRYRESLSASRAKDDRRDAHALARFVLERHCELQPWQPADEQTRALSAVTEKRRQLVDLRTSITNKLTQALKDTYPQSLELVGRYLYSPLACAFLNKWPTLADLRKARPATIKTFYYTHGSRRPEVIEKRLTLIAGSVPLCTDPIELEVATELIRAFVKQLQALTASIARFDRLIAQATAKHEDA